MAKQAADRYNTGAAFVDALNKLVATAPQGAVLQETSARKAGSGGRIAAGAATQQRTRISARQHSSRPAWLMPAVAAAAVFGLAVSAWWLLSPSSETPVVEPPATDASSQASATQAAPATDAPLPADFVAPRPVDAADSAEVERLLNAGDQLFEYATKVELGRKLDHPDNDSALGYYRRALALDPQNARASAGIAEIVGFYRTYSHQACERAQWVQCGFLVRKGLAVSSEDPYLLLMQEAARVGEAGETPTLPPAPTPSN
jgi:serine/threonine-protein kinase PpkA